MSTSAPLSAQELRQLLAEHGGWAAASRATGLNVSMLKSRASSLGVTVDGNQSQVPESSPRQTVETGKDTASAEFVEATVKPDDVPTDADLLKRANLDPAEWEVVTRRQSVWEAQGKGGEEKTMRSLRVSYGRVKPTLSDAVLPAFGGRPVTVKQPKRIKREDTGTELVVIVSDFHAPYHDEVLLEKCEQVLLKLQPDRLILNGDLVDFPTVGRHAKTTNNCRASANECIQAGGEILARLKAAVPEDCLFQFVSGNHDAWLSHYLYRQAGDAADLCVAGTDVPVWSLRNLLRMDELGIEMVGAEDQWQHATVKLTNELVVRHGLSVRAGSAASVIANLKSATFASITGHTHRLGLAGVTRNKPKGHKILLGAEIGGMFQMPRKPTDWPTYIAHDRLDWQPGFAVCEIVREPSHKAGHYSLELASFQNGTLMLRGQRW